MLPMLTGQMVKEMGLLRIMRRMVSKELLGMCLKANFGMTTLSAFRT